jgi:hypothetical protein
LQNALTLDNGEPDTSPRAWAFAIIRCQSLEGRRGLLASVPTHLRALVETHVRIAWERKRFESGKD